MSISLNANFELLSAGLYLDARQQFNTIIEMKDFAETSIPDGFITYNKETQKHYVFNSSNTVDATLGKWREYNSGDSSSTTYATWNSNVDYKVGNIVLKDEVRYSCIADHTSTDFETDSINWVVVLEQYYHVTQEQYNKMVSDGLITDGTKDLYIIDGNTNCNDNENAGIEIYEDYSQFPMDFEFDCVVYAKNEYLDNGVTYNNGFYFANATTGTYTKLGGSSEKQIKDWVSGSSYLEGDYIYHEGELYRCLASNSDVDFDESNWEQITYGIDELSKEDVEGLLGLTKEEIEAMADLILDTEVRIDKTYSSSKIYTDIQQCLEDSKTYTLEEIARASTTSYKVVTDVVDMTEEKYLYLLYDGTTNYDIYIVETDGTPTKIGNTQIDLSNYYTKTEIDNDFLKKVDADGKYATITTVDGKVDKDKIVTALNDTVTDEQVASALLTKTELDKTNAKLGELSDSLVDKQDFRIFKSIEEFNEKKGTSFTVVSGVDNMVDITKAMSEGDMLIITTKCITGSEIYFGLDSSTGWTKMFTFIKANGLCDVECRTTAPSTFKRVLNTDGVVGAWQQLATMDNLDGLFQSVSDGKTLVANAITDKGVPTAIDATFATMASNIRNLNGIGYKSESLSGSKEVRGGSTASISLKFSNTVIGVMSVTYSNSNSYQIYKGFSISGNTVTVKIEVSSTYTSTMTVQCAVKANILA